MWNEALSQSQESPFRQLRYTSTLPRASLYRSLEPEIKVLVCYSERSDDSSPFVAFHVKSAHYSSIEVNAVATVPQTGEYL